MIKSLENTRESVAVSIREIFQKSYAVEAKLLGAESNFPPLNRSLADFLCTDTTFYGFHIKDRIAGVMELKMKEEHIHIQSLVVDPDFFRKGIASGLLSFLFENFKSNIYYVETGAANEPAIALYERFGFILVNKWMTDVGIEKVAFTKT